MSDIITIADYEKLPRAVQQRIREKCRHEAMTILAVMKEWPSLWRDHG